METKNTLQAISELALVIKCMSESYALMIKAAEDMNDIALASKCDIKQALDRANCMGKSLDNCIAAVFFLTKACLLDYFSDNCCR